jgi:hypothetical protein
MMFYGDTPWHGLGKELDHPATSAEAIRASDLDWEVVKQPLYVKTDQGYRRVEDKFMMMRADQLESEPGFGIVSSNYTPMQNSEAFNFFDDIVGQGAAIYHTAGALGQGGTLVLGDLSIQGNINGLLSLMENGALRALVPLSSESQFAGLPEEVVEKVDLEFYADVERAVAKALEG